MRATPSPCYGAPGADNARFCLLAFDRSAPHLNNKHTIFGRVAGGMDTLDRIESVGNDKKERPLAEITIIRTDVFVDPVPEAEAELRYVAVLCSMSVVCFLLLVCISHSLTPVLVCREELAERIAARKAAEQQRRHAGKATAAAPSKPAAQVEMTAEPPVAEPKKRVREPEAPSVGKYLRGVEIPASTAPQDSAAEEASAPIIPTKKAVRGTFGNFDAW